MSGMHEFVPGSIPGVCAREDCELPRANRRHHLPVAAHPDPSGPEPAPPPLPFPPRQVPSVGLSEVAADTVRRVMARPGTIAARIISELATNGFGATDDALEQRLMSSHQAVSGIRNRLGKNGVLVPMLDEDEQPVQRPTRYGRPAVVWTLSRAAQAVYDDTAREDTA